MTRFEMLKRAKKYLDNNSFEDVQLHFYYNDDLTLYLSDVMIGFAKQMIEEQKELLRNPWISKS